MSSFTAQEERARESSGDGNTMQKKRKWNENRKERKGRRIQHLDSSKKLESLTLGDDEESEATDNQDSDDESEYLPSSPRRPSISPLEDEVSTVSGASEKSTFLPLTPTLPTTTITTTPVDPLSPKLAKINEHINNDNLRAAYQLLSTTTRGSNWQATATRESVIKVYNYMKLLGDGKKQCLEQANIINDGRRREMELEAEVNKLATELARLKAERN